MQPLQKSCNSCVTIAGEYLTSEILSSHIWVQEKSKSSSIFKFFSLDHCFPLNKNIYREAGGNDKTYLGNRVVAPHPGIHQDRDPQLSGSKLVQESIFLQHFTISSAYDSK